MGRNSRRNWIWEAGLKVDRLNVNFKMWWLVFAVTTRENPALSLNEIHSDLRGLSCWLVSIFWQSIHYIMNLSCKAILISLDFGPNETHMQ
jgi:hypothetical protein